MGGTLPEFDRMGVFAVLGVALVGLQLRRFWSPGFRPAKRDSTLGLRMCPLQGQDATSLVPNLGPGLTRSAPSEPSSPALNPDLSRSALSELSSAAPPLRRTYFNR